MDEKDLKIIALRERIGSEAQRYAEEIAQLRVELTVKSQQVQTLQEENHKLIQDLNVNEETEPVVVDGEVVDNG